MSTNRRKIDYLIIGSGTAGLGARRVIAAQTDSYLVADPGPFGTTCARVGCMPSKLLIAAANRAHEVGTLSKFGVESGGVSIDAKAVLHRVRSERDRFVGFVVEDMGEWTEKHLLRHKAHFLEPNVVQVGDEIIEAKRIVLAVGGRPRILPAFRAFPDRVLTSDTIFEVDDLPTSLAVVGVGVIGLELGQSMHRLGVKTTFFGRSCQIGGTVDPKVRSEAFRILGEELELHANVDLPLHMEETNKGLHMSWHQEDGETGEGYFDKILLAAGRAPNTSTLALENSGLEIDGRGIPVHNKETLQCGDSPVFIAGDATNEKTLLHEASDEGRVAGAGALGYPNAPGGLRRVPISVVFTEPNIIDVGMSYRDFDESLHAAGEVSFWNQGRSRVMGINKGILRIYGDRKTRKLLGASGIGPHQEHLAHLLSWAIGADLTVDRALEMPFYHPVIEEGVRTALRDLKKNMA